MVLTLAASQGPSKLYKLQALQNHQIFLKRKFSPFSPIPLTCFPRGRVTYLTGRQLDGSLYVCGLASLALSFRSVCPQWSAPLARAEGKVVAAFDFVFQNCHLSNNFLKVQCGHNGCEESEESIMKGWLWETLRKSNFKMEAFVHTRIFCPPTQPTLPLVYSLSCQKLCPWEAVCICQMTECINSFQRRRSWCPILASGPSCLLFSSLISSKVDVDSHLMPVCISQSFPNQER